MAANTHDVQWRKIRDAQRALYCDASQPYSLPEIPKLGHPLEALPVT
jgi:hypothetical protein